MKHYLTTLLLCTSLAANLFSQENDAQYPSFQFDGVLKTKFEYAPEPGMSRFSVRNSRLGVSGKIYPKVDYRAQIELSNEGKFQVLDLSGTITPIDGLSFTIGQTNIPVFNSYTINPGTMMFANRTFLGKYFAGTRDIGLLTKYSHSLGSVPFGFDFGIYNGNTINDPQWRDKLSVAARLTIGDMKGWRSTMKIYDYPNSPEIHYLLYGADLRYATDNWKIETEVMKRDDKVNGEDLFAGYLQSAYCFPLKPSYLFKSMMPAARYDFVDKTGNDIFDVSRLTLGWGFGLSKKPFDSLLRIDYEWYFVNNLPDFLQSNEEMAADKLTIELVYIF
jgi:hypothetical protein